MAIPHVAAWGAAGEGGVGGAGVEKGWREALWEVVSMNRIISFYERHLCKSFLHNHSGKKQSTLHSM